MAKKKKIIVWISALVLLTLTLIGLTYAYYKTRIIENAEEKSVSIVSKKLEIVYDDGNGLLSATDVNPGYTNKDKPKTFTVTNTGDESISYALYLEDVINGFNKGIEQRGDYNDWTYEVTCSPNCSGTDGEVDYPKLSEMVAKNTISSGVTQSYSVVIKYKNLSNIDQSDDMGQSISGKFQIYSLEDVIDIEGTVASYNEGDYVQINSIEKKSQIVNGKYRLPAVEVGKHTLKIMSKDDEMKGITTLNIEKGAEGVSGSTITIDNKSQSVTLNITDVSNELGIQIKNIGAYAVHDGTLLYSVLNNNEVKEPLSLPGKDVSLENEAVLAAAEDNYGKSYYFRGNVVNNYVTYANMCWRIVRVQGDGTIKLTLSDGYHACGTANGYNESNNMSAFISYGDQNTGYYYENALYTGIDYFASSIPDIINNWAIRKSLATKDSSGKMIYDDKLVKTAWCNDTSIGKDNSRGWKPGGETTYNKWEAKWWFIAYDYAAYTRIISNKTPSLLCGDSETYFTIGILNADEVVFAGSKYGSGTYSHYLMTNTAENYWTMSPAQFDSYGVTSDIGLNFAVNEDGSLVMLEYGYDDIGDIESYAWIRPAIVLRSDVLLKTGLNYIQDGTVDRPYVIN